MLSNKVISDLVKKQIKLDDYISKSKNIDQNTEDIFKKKVVAYFVELGEFINEERSFKFWSNKPSSEKEVMLEEYIDGLHFLLSLSISCEFEFDNFTFKENNKDITDAYLDNINKLSSFISTDYRSSKQHKAFLELFNCFLNIGNCLKWTEMDIIEIYNKKNDINFKRQDNNY